VSLQAWSCVIAFLGPILPAILVARLLRSWILFVSMLGGTLWGLWPYLPVIGARYEDPIDELRVHTVFVLQGTITGALFGLGVGVGILLIRKRFMHGRSPASPEKPGFS
jgi:hypothetical protein